MAELNANKSSVRQRISLTGGTGFVGAKTLQALLDQGHFVRALVRKPARVASITHKNLEWLEGGLGDVDDQLVKDANCVVHIAGLIKAQRRDDFYKVNERDTKALATVSEAAGVARFIHLSSMVARQPQLSDYAGSKYAGEQAIKSVYSGKLAIIRAPAVFGPDDVATRPFYSLIEKGLLPIPGGQAAKTRLLSMVYIKDLVRAIERDAVKGLYDNRIVSPATIDPLSWIEFAQYASRAAKRPVRTLPLPISLLYGVGAVTSVTSRLFNKGHLTLGKLNEFLYEDWSGADILSDATPFLTALEETLRDYRT